MTYSFESYGRTMFFRVIDAGETYTSIVWLDKSHSVYGYTAVVLTAELQEYKNCKIVRTE